MAIKRLAKLIFNWHNVSIMILSVGIALAGMTLLICQTLTGDEINKDRVFIDVTQERLPFFFDGSEDADMADIDNDKDLDIIAIVKGTDIVILVNDGKGHFTDESGERLPEQEDIVPDYHFQEVDLADVDGDGDKDIYLTADNSHQDILLINDGKGIFADETKIRLPWISNSGIDADFGDVDSDGDLDIYVANGFDAPNMLLINDGKGYFTDKSSLQLPEGVYNSREIDFGDVDGDGDLDIMLANGAFWEDTNRQNRLLMNKGGGYFADETIDRLPTDNEPSLDADFGDVDGDKDLDIIVVGLHPPHLLINNGRGEFLNKASAQLPRIDKDEIFDADFADFDRDGDLDILMGAILLVNDGKGIFTNRSVDYLPPMPKTKVCIENVDLGDVNGDGYPDIFMATLYGLHSQLWLNSVKSSATKRR